MGRDISRRIFLQIGAAALGAVAVSDFKELGNAFAADQVKSQVFFTEDISVNGLLKIYSKINQSMTGRIGIKLHTGEPHGSNILPLDMVYKLPEAELQDLKERIESRQGLRQLSYMKEMKMGNDQYELVQV